MGGLKAKVKLKVMLEVGMRSNGLGGLGNVEGKNGLYKMAGMERGKASGSC